MRERRYYSYKSISPDRITPAYAGKTIHLRRRPPETRDHPRVCGKDYLFKNSTEGHVGSPPRMRERQDIRSESARFCGITPAYAGKTFWGRKIPCGARDHPRVCGKDIKFTFKIFFTLGSPPRMRERHCNTSFISSSKRITPAYAGKTKKRRMEHWKKGDHPRVCGKDEIITNHAGKVVGSPPRMRERQ